MIIKYKGNKGKDFSKKKTSTANNNLRSNGYNIYRHRQSIGLMDTQANKLAAKPHQIQFLFYSQVVFICRANLPIYPYPNIYMYIVCKMLGNSKNVLLSFWAICLI